MPGRKRKVNANSSTQTCCSDILGSHSGLVEDLGRPGGDAVLF
jgi:hypothetical protein